MTGEFPAQKNSNTETVSVSWHHYVLSMFRLAESPICMSLTSTTMLQDSSVCRTEQKCVRYVPHRRLHTHVWSVSCLIFHNMTKIYLNKSIWNVDTLRPRQNGRHFTDHIFKCIFLNKDIWILIDVSLKFVSKCSINNISALVQIMAWRRPGNKPLPEPMMVRLLMHICVTRPQWVKWLQPLFNSRLPFDRYKYEMWYVW